MDNVTTWPGSSAHIVNPSQRYPDSLPKGALWARRCIRTCPQMEAVVNRLHCRCIPRRKSEADLEAWKFSRIFKAMINTGRLVYLLSTCFLLGSLPTVSKVRALQLRLAFGPLAMELVRGLVDGASSKEGRVLEKVSGATVHIRAIPRTPSWPA